MKKKETCYMCGKQFEVSWWGGFCPHCSNKKNGSNKKKAASLIPSTCGKCGKDYKVTRKGVWKRAMIGIVLLEKGWCPACAKKDSGNFSSLGTKKNIWEKWTTERDENNKGFAPLGPLHKIPIVDLLLHIVVAFVLWKVLPPFILGDY